MSAATVSPKIPRSTAMERRFATKSGRSCTKRSGAGQRPQKTEEQLDGSVGAADKKVIGALDHFHRGVGPRRDDRAGVVGRAVLVVLGDGHQLRAMIRRSRVI